MRENPIAISELVELLSEAATVVASLRELSVYCPYDSPEEFANHLRSLNERIARRDDTALAEVCGIFAPTGAWDDGIGASGMGIANRVMELRDQLSIG